MALAMVKIFCPKKHVKITVAHAPPVLFFSLFSSHSVLAVDGVGVTELLGYPRHHACAPAPPVQQIQAAFQSVASQLSQQTSPRARDR
jgi:hypothetical protein